MPSVNKNLVGYEISLRLRDTIGHLGLPSSGKERFLHAMSSRQIALKYLRQILKSNTAAHNQRRAGHEWRIALELSAQ